MRFLKPSARLAFTLALMHVVTSLVGCSSMGFRRPARSGASRTERLLHQEDTAQVSRSDERRPVSSDSISPETQRRELQAPHTPALPSSRDRSFDLIRSPEYSAPVDFASAHTFATEAVDEPLPAIEIASEVTLSGEPSYGQQTSPVLTLELLEQMAFGQNPALRQATATVGQARGIYQQVGLNPNPTVGYFGQEIGNDGAGGQHGGFVSQTWIRGEKLNWNRRVLAHEVSASNWQTHVQQQRIRTDLRVVYCDVLSAQLRLQLAEEFRTVAEEAVELATEKLKAEVGTRPDLLQSEIQLSEIDLVIQQAEIDHAAALQQLSALCGVADFADAIVAGNFDDLSSSASPIASDEEAILAELFASSPELAVAQSQIERACANLQRQKVQPIPNVTTQLGVGADDATGDAFTNLQVSLPVPVHNKNQGNIRAASAAYQAAMLNAERIRTRLRRDLAQALREYRGAEAIVRNYDDRILPKAQTALELVQAGKEAGEFDFLRVLTTRRVYFDSNLQFIAAQAKLAQARARIDGKLLTDSLSQSVVYSGDDSLRGQALSGQ